MVAPKLGVAVRISLSSSSLSLYYTTKKRETTTRGFTNKLRNDGFIPAILYGGKDPNLNISIEKKNIQSVIKSENFLSKVLELDIEGKKEKVLPREVSYNVVSDEPIHIDFLRIVL